MRGRSSNTTSEPAPPISATRDAMIPASRSRRKHGLSQLTQNVCLNEKTTCAYSAATVDLPKPAGATRKRATSRERRRSAMRWGREWVAEEATYLGRRPLHEHDIRKSDIGVPLPKAKAAVGKSTRRTEAPPYRMCERDLSTRRRSFSFVSQNKPSHMPPRKREKPAARLLSAHCRQLKRIGKIPKKTARGQAHFSGRLGADSTRLRQVPAVSASRSRRQLAAFPPISCQFFVYFLGRSFEMRSEYSTSQSPASFAKSSTGASFHNSSRR